MRIIAHTHTHPQRHIFNPFYCLCYVIFFLSVCRITKHVFFLSSQHCTVHTSLENSIRLSRATVRVKVSSSQSLTIADRVELLPTTVIQQPIYTQRYAVHKQRQRNRATKVDMLPVLCTVWSVRLMPVGTLYMYNLPAFVYLGSAMV